MQVHFTTAQLVNVYVKDLTVTIILQLLHAKVAIATVESVLDHDHQTVLYAQVLGKCWSMEGAFAPIKHSRTILPRLVLLVTSFAQHASVHPTQSVRHVHMHQQSQM